MLRLKLKSSGIWPNVEINRCAAFTIFSIFWNLTQCSSHKDLPSPELHQFGFRAARSIKTALLEVTKGLCRTELKATSFPSPLFTPQCRLLTSWVCFSFVCLGYLKAFLLMDHYDEHVILLFHNTGSLRQSPRAHSFWSDLCGPFSCNIMSVLSSPLMLYALLLLWSHQTLPCFNLIWHEG